MPILPCSYFWTFAQCSVSSKFTLRMSDVFYVYVSFETCDRCHCYHYHCFDLRKNDFVSGLILNGCKKGPLNLLINSIINAIYTVLYKQTTFLNHGKHATPSFVPDFHWDEEKINFENFGNLN